MYFDPEALETDAAKNAALPPVIAADVADADAADANAAETSTATAPRHGTVTATLGKHSATFGVHRKPNALHLTRMTAAQRKQDNEAAMSLLIDMVMYVLGPEFGAYEQWFSAIADADENIDVADQFESLANLFAAATEQSLGHPKA